MSLNSVLKKILTSIATLGPIGYFPIVPGTWGSAVGIILYWFIYDVASLTTLIMLFVVFIIISIITSTIAEQKLGYDARPIVIDEFIGQWIALILCPHKWQLYIAGFIIFRLFDVVKPFPIRQSQKLPKGLGITMDDILAGLYTALCLYLLRRFIFGSL